ncbi:MAG: HEPN domain protein [Clostridia bacterium 62_21]|nr:MAG: HEPN domain protein [Clostridia bacterium 62_21]
MAQHRLKIAEERLTAAKMLAAGGLYEDAVSRAYYAVFQAARAALVALGLEEPRKHSGLVSFFNQHLIKTGLVEKEYGRILMSIRDLRQASDYDDFFGVEETEAEAAIRDAGKFLARVRKLLGFEAGSRT